MVADGEKQLSDAANECGGRSNRSRVRRVWMCVFVWVEVNVDRAVCVCVCGGVCVHLTVSSLSASSH